MKRATWTPSDSSTITTINDGAADDDAGAPAEEVGAVGHKGDGEHAPHGEHVPHGERGGDQAQDRRAGVVELVTPLRHALQTVYEGAIVSWRNAAGQWTGLCFSTESQGERTVSRGRQHGRP